MLKCVRKNLTDNPPAMGVGSAFQLPLKDKSVDCIFSARLYHHVPDPKEREQYLLEMCRVSRGWIVFTYFHTWSLKNMLRRLRRPFNKKKAKNTMTTAELREIVKPAGFEVVASMPLSRLASGHHYAVLRRC